MSSPQQNTRTRILNAALKLLENAPNSQTSMSAIAKQAGISRQAVYLHFANRAELLIAATRHIDEITDLGAAIDRNATLEGVLQLDSFIRIWGNYIPVIYGVARALMAMKDTDAAACQAWQDRMNAVRRQCHATIDVLLCDGVLNRIHSPQQATDILWTLLSVRNWEQLTVECGWSQEMYIEKTITLARQVLVTPAT